MPESAPTVDLPDQPTDLPDQPSEEADQPTEEASLSSGLVQADNLRLAEFANKLMEDAPSESQTERALHLTQRLAELLELQPLSAKIASSLETFRTLSGDSPAQAILLAALLRNQRIPARLASGLRIEPKLSRLGFQMWTEAGVVGGWLPLDATTGGARGIDCLKSRDTTLADDNPYPAIMPIFEMMDEITIQYSGSE